jgi:hypothetical protein
MNAALGLLTTAVVLSSGFGLDDPAAVLDESTAGLTDGAARIRGVVESIADSGFALATPSGKVTVVTTPATRFRIAGVEDAGLEDLAVGDRVVAAGRRDGDGLFHAVVVARVRADLGVPVGGVLTALTSDGVELRARRGGVTLWVDAGTTYTVRGIENAGFEGLAVGMRALARATLQDDGTLLAKSIAAAPPPLRPIQLRGEVTAISGRTFTLRRSQGNEVEVRTDADTKFRVAGVEDATIANLTVGDRIVGRGVLDQDGDILARLVAVVPDHVAGVYGRVAGIEARTLLLQTDRGRVRVVTDGDTRYRIPGIVDGGFEDLVLGELVLASGAWKSESVLAATVVAVRRPQQHLPNTIRGGVVGIGSDHLLLDTADGQVRVLVREDTSLRVLGVRDPDLEDVLVGAKARATGMWTADNALVARSVLVVNPR